MHTQYSHYTDSDSPPVVPHPRVETSMCMMREETISIKNGNKDVYVERKCQSKVHMKTLGVRVTIVSAHRRILGMASVVYETRNK